MKYTIADQYLDNLAKKVTRIQKKCASLGLPFSFEVLEPTTIDWVENVAGVAIKRSILAHVVEVSGVAKINGWQLIGKIEHTDAGNLLFGTPDVEFPEAYRDAKPYCEHCGVHRFRKETFVIRNEAGEYKQVGRSCLMLYTNGMNAEACAEYASIAHEIEEMDHVAGTGWEPCSSLAEMVASCYEHINEFGYDKQKLLCYVPDSLYTCKIPFNVWASDSYKKFKEQTDAIIASARALENVSDYLANVKVAFAADFVCDKHLILVASYVYRCIKDAIKAKATAKKAADSNWVGNVGERVSFTVKVVDGNAYRVLFAKEHYVNRYVTALTTVVEFIDENGNVLKWDASNLSEIDEAVSNGAETLTIKATVKAHDEYKGVKQTVITRARLA